MNLLAVPPLLGPLAWWGLILLLVWEAARVLAVGFAALGAPGTGTFPSLRTAVLYWTLLVGPIPEALALAVYGDLHQGWILLATQILAIIASPIVWWYLGGCITTARDALYRARHGAAVSAAATGSGWSTMTGTSPGRSPSP
ncbi:hypothetical protein BIV57_00595 [Mangrovactinospora gilvigrisea]|uniref:Uncharacterized protein n=1 Tax=Mangrovactinospora gilvigrisea TaxID=1428644 RepID=A0A1J7CCU9_9ACTN|nr:hypothetical protein [Mangrovactinospora gilvigrisea]OIV39376.1 hypothetical protein BIV57_00595 [Mangrovactinospora gilvigrisea]